MVNEKHKAGLEASAGGRAHSPAKTSSPVFILYSSFSIFHFPLNPFSGSDAIWVKYRAVSRRS